MDDRVGIENKGIVGPGKREESLVLSEDEKLYALDCECVSTN